MTIPDYQTLMRPVLEFGAQGETSVRDCIAALANKLGLSDDEPKRAAAKRQTGGLRQPGPLGQDLSRPSRPAGDHAPRSLQIDPRGSEVLARHRAKVDNEFLMQFAEFREFRARSRLRAGDDSAHTSEVLPVRELVPASTPEDRIEAAFTEITNELQVALLDGMMKGTPQFFEKVVVDLLTSMGYGGSRANAGRRVGKTADGGIDGVINEDPLGLDIV